MHWPTSVRFLARRKAVAAMAVLTMALALGANTAAFAVVRAFLFSGLAVPEPDRLVVIAPERQVPGRGAALFYDAWPNYELIRQIRHAFADVACLTSTIVSWDDRGEIRSLQATVATASFFATVGVQPALGRAFTASEEGPAPAPVVVVSHALWKGALGGDPAAIGRPLVLNGVPTTVIGVMPEGFAQPVPTDVWLPFDLPPAQRAAIHGGRILTIWGRIASSATREAAQADAAAFTRRTREANAADNGAYHYVLQTLREQLLDGADSTVLLIQAGAGVLLILAVVNLSSLLVAWGFERTREMAVRRALGAGRLRLVRLLTAQSGVVVTAGFAGGPGLAQLAISLVRRADLGPSLGFFFNALRLDGTVLLLGAAVTGLAGLAAGALPVWIGRRADLATALRASSRSFTLSTSALRWQKVTVVVQVALVTLILTSAALVALTFRNLARVPDGFSAANRVVARITLPDAAYPSHATRVAFTDALLRNLEREPDLRSFGFSNTLPVGDAPWGGRFLVPSLEGAAARDPLLFNFRRVSPGYLPAMGIPLVRGRHFTVHDDARSAPVAIISAALAARYFAGRDAVGDRILRVTSSSVPPQALQIVGVAGNVMDAGYNAPPGETVYVPYAQTSVSRLSIVAESDHGAAAGLSAVRDALKSTDRVVSASGTTTLEALVAETHALPRLRAAVLLGFALVAVAIAGLGSYGVTGQLMANREREFVIRLVFGALPGALGRTVFAQVTKLTLVGVIAGLGGSWTLAGTLRSFLFGVEPRSAALFATVGCSVLALAALATAPSALRAMRLDARQGAAAD